MVEAVSLEPYPQFYIKKQTFGGLLWWLSDENPPGNAGDMGLVPDSGGSHMPSSNLAHAPQLLNLCSRAWGPQLLNEGSLRALEPLLCSERSHHS